MDQQLMEIIQERINKTVQDLWLIAWAGNLSLEAVDWFSESIRNDAMLLVVTSESKRGL